MKKVKATPGNGWAWKIKDRKGGWALCHWVEPYKPILLGKEKPTPEAKAVYVRIIEK